METISDDLAYKIKSIYSKALSDRWESLGGITYDPVSAVSWGENRIDLFYRGYLDHAVWHRWWDGSKWSDEESLRGVTKSSVSAVSWGKDRIDLFYRGEKDEVKHKWWDRSKWSEDCLGGSINGPVSAVSWGENRIDLFVCGKDNAVWHKWYDGYNWSSEWESISKTCLIREDSIISAVSWGPNRFDLFVRGKDNAILHKWYDDSRWSDWEWESLGGQTENIVSAVSWGKDRIDLFIRDATNAKVMHKWYDDSKWSVWESMEAITCDAISAVSCEKNHLDIFSQHNNVIYHKWWDGFRWSDWKSLGGQIHSVCAIFIKPNRIALLARGTNNAINHRLGIEEPTTNTSPDFIVPQQTGNTVWGFANIHEHLFANLAYGGAAFWGAPFHEEGINYALSKCDKTDQFETLMPFLNSSDEIKSSKSELMRSFDKHPLQSTKFKRDWTQFWTGTPIGSEWYPIHGDGKVKKDEFLKFFHPSFAVSQAIGREHGPSGPPDFTDWPAYNNGGHQQIYHKWLERAYMGGLRLFVNLCVHNKALWLFSFTREEFKSQDMDAIDRQIEATKDMEAYIDKLSGGAGKGWFRIAYTSSDARKIIKDGKMAVVIGIETDFLFESHMEFESEFTSEYIQSKINKYKNKGVRYMFMMHFYDNAFGGAAPMPLGEISSLFTTGTLFQKEPVEGLGFQCNKRGLSCAGEDLFKHLMSNHIMVDVDHMGYHMKNTILELAEKYNYPVNSSHATCVEKSSLKDEFTYSKEQFIKIRDLGGVISVGMRDSTVDIVDKYKKVLEFASAGKNTDDQYPRIGISLDLGCFLPQSPPRKSTDEYPVNTRDDYSFDSYEKDCNGKPIGKFYMQKTGSRTFNYYKDGLAHIGLLPDLLEDLRKLLIDKNGNPKQYNTQTGPKDMTLGEEFNKDMTLDPLFNSAEGFIRMWEKVEAAKINID
jgi:microsomal dipeptidase-like Zn-dependent dipeptidase